MIYSTSKDFWKTSLYDTLPLKSLLVMNSTHAYCLKSISKGKKAIVNGMNLFEWRIQYCKDDIVNPKAKSFVSTHAHPIYKTTNVCIM